MYIHIHVHVPIYIHVHTSSYCSSGALIGFVCIKNHLSNFECQLETGSGVAEQPLAKMMLVIMVRGLFSGLQFQCVQFPCSAL